MQIGEFAKICNTKISVLRHYDKEGLLTPDYIDRFTGYRYYSKEQIPVFLRISALKSAGFSLSDIKNVLENCKTNQDVINVFEKKKNELNNTLKNLEQARLFLLGVKKMYNVVIFEKEKTLKAKCILQEESEYDKICEEIEKTLFTEGYQRISVFSKVVDSKTNSFQIECTVVKLKAEEIELNENINLPFVNDESIIGKWKTIGEFAVKEDFNSYKPIDNMGEHSDGIYFLPDGERYWCYGWTKNKLLVDNGINTIVHDFTVENYSDTNYMFIDLKSYNYLHGGKTTVLVLKQLDNISYSATEIAKKDDINKPFINDEKLIGKWKSVDYIKRKSDFNPNNTSIKKLFWSQVDFKHNGEVVSFYDWGNDIISGEDQQTWTKGYLLRKWNNSACAYEIVTYNGNTFLIIEWKSGDYRYGGFDTDYYVFIKE